MMELCVFCNEHISPGDETQIFKKGLKRIIESSIEREDGLHEVLQKKSIPFCSHARCRLDYTRSKSIQSYKKQKLSDAESSTVDVAGTTPVLRSDTPGFDIKNDCLYCGENITAEPVEKQALARRRSVSEVTTLNYVNTVLKCASKRNDEWAEIVRIRVQAVNDLVAEEAKYHHDCAVKFRMGRKLGFEDDNLVSSASGRPLDYHKHCAFEKLCNYLETNDECQYSIDDIEVKMNEFLGDKEGYSKKRLTQKLKEYFGNDIIMTSMKGKETVVSFRDLGNKILREKWQSEHASSPDKKWQIIDMAANIIRDDIRMQVYNLSEYPTIEETYDGRRHVPESLERFLHAVIKPKVGNCSNPNIVNRRCTAVAHSIISACRPRSFVSPILLAIAVYIHRKYASRDLIDILSSLGFADDYKEVLRLNQSFMSEDEPSYDLDGFTQFVFDNADFNVATVTGHNTFHSMGGIACITPGKQKAWTKVKRSMNVSCKDVSGQFGQVPIQFYKPSRVKGLKSVLISPLTSPNPQPVGLKSGECLDSLWMSTLMLGNSPWPSWSGFMQTYVKGHGHERSSIQILPFINLDPSNLSTIYTALCFAQKLCDRYNLGICPVTFDQPLYIKAAEIVLSSPEISQLFVRLGGFHLLMSYLGSVGYIMSGTGIETLWETVYAGNTVIHMLTGHAYARALRAHILTSAATVCVLLNTSRCVDKIKPRLRFLLKTVMEQEYDYFDNDNELRIQEINQILSDVMHDAASQSRTGKLWTNYLEQIAIVRLFLRAERTGDWELHLYCIYKMIPLFHAAGHLAYAKSARLYVQQMKALRESLPPDQYRLLTEKGYFTIRRSEHFWAGNFSDQVIEQDLMRLLKSSGGITHGRGITDSTLSKWVHALPQCIPICEGLERFTGIYATRSEQHKDLRPSSITRDRQDYDTFHQWLEVHSPFSYTDPNNLVSVSTGIIANARVNCDEAYTIGLSAAQAVKGVSFADLKLKRKDRVVTFAGSENSFVVRRQDVDINPDLLFMRITCVIKDSSEMEEFLAYELSPNPPALFKNGIMRKTAKSELGSLLKARVEAHNTVPENAIHVIDGGHLLHAAQWPKEATYDDIYHHYITYVTYHYGLADTIIVFDGYESKNTTKAAEQERRAGVSTSSTIIFEDIMKTTTTQKCFLGNSANKKRLIDKLIKMFDHNGVTVKQAEADADYLIVSTAMNVSVAKKQPVVVVGTDTDLLVMLIAQAPQTSNIFMLTSQNPVVLYSISELQTAWQNVRHHLLFAHAITGCDTVSSLYNIGKKKALHVLSDSKNFEWLNVFYKPDSVHEDIARAGERFLLILYGACQISSINRYRYVSYARIIGKCTLTSSFKLECLPPTSAAAKFHSYRAFHIIQQWLGEKKDPVEWGWHRQGGILVPLTTDIAVAPDRLLRMISCGCSCGCGKACGCRKLGLYCTVMCSKCYGEACTNCPPITFDLHEEND